MTTTSLVPPWLFVGVKRAAVTVAIFECRSCCPPPRIEREKGPEEGRPTAFNAAAGGKYTAA